jgi:thiol-disulfide isomerase/thioredoxin
MWSPNKLKRAIAAVSALAVFGIARAEIRVGDAFPPLPSAAPADPALPATRGRVVLVDFWASWCAPCKASFPAYARIYADYAPRGLVIVAVSVDDDASGYAAFVRKHAPPFPTVLDRDKKLVSAVAVPAMPTSYLIGRDGRVRFVHEGFHSGETERELRAEIAALFGEKN